MSQRLIYRCSPSIIWVKDISQTVVVDRETGQSWALHDVEAVIWDLLTVGYVYQRIVPMLSLIFSLSVEEAKHTLDGTLRRWQEAHVVQVFRE